MRITFLLLIITTLITAEALGADALPGSISGVVLDRATLTLLDGANVLIAGTTTGTATDASGRFLLTDLKPGSYSIQISLLGYYPESRSDVIVNPGRRTELEFQLEATPVKGQEVVVHVGYFRPRADLPTSNRSLRSEEIRRSPGSAEDVQRVIQALPGVAGANDQTNEIVVRGGSPDENLTLIDGIEIDNVNHFPAQSSSGGPISALNINFLKDVTFATGGYSSRYGDKTSSVMALELRDGSRERWLTEGELSMAGAGIDVEGPLGSERRGTLIASVRRSYLNLIQGAIGLTAVPNYYDGQIRASWEFSATLKGSIYGMYTRDWINIESDEPDAWSRGVETVAAKYQRRLLGGRLHWINGWGVSELVLASVTNVSREQVIEMPEQQLTYRNESTEWARQIHLNLNGKSFDRDEWTAGLSLKPLEVTYNNWYKPDTIGYDLNGDGNLDTLVASLPWGMKKTISTNKYAGYLQYRYQRFSTVSFTGGLRYDGYELTKRNVFGPRASLRWQIDPATSLSVATGLYHQALGVIDLTIDPTGSNRELPYVTASHYVLSLERGIGDGSQATLELFRKDYRDVPISEEDLNDDVDPTFRSQRLLPLGSKIAEGLELFFQQKMVDDWYGTASYSLGRSTTDDSHRDYPSKYDFRHVATLTGGREFCLIDKPWFNRLQRSWYGWWTHALPLNGDEVTLSSRFRYVSGRPYTPRVYRVALPRVGYHWDESGDIASERYPDYARWDVRWDSKWYAGSRSVTVFLEIQNILNRANVADYFYDDDNPEVTTAYQFPFFFVGGFRIAF
jgi:hypothetical protein